MVNPNDIMGTTAAFMGRTSPNAFNDVLSAYKNSGIMSGWTCRPLSGMTLQIGGATRTRDVAIAEDAVGNRLSINTRDSAKGVPIEITLPEADAENPRIDAIVAYINNPPEVVEDIPTVDNPSVCAMLVVTGEPAAEPIAPNDEEIRAAITADEGSGATAYYVVLATILVEAGMTDITNNQITPGKMVVAETGLNIAEGIIEGSEDIPTSGQVYDAITSDVETYVVDPESWGEITGAAPFAYSASIVATHTITSHTVIELVNNNAVSFANYGFAIGAITGQNIVIYALNVPIDEISLTINYKERTL